MSVVLVAVMSVRENGRYALITACADGGLGHACIIEKYDK